MPFCAFFTNGVSFALSAIIPTPFLIPFPVVFIGDAIADPTFSPFCLPAEKVPPFNLLPTPPISPLVCFTAPPANFPASPAPFNIKAPPPSAIPPPTTAALASPDVASLASPAPSFAASPPPKYPPRSPDNFSIIKQPTITSIAFISPDIKVSVNSQFSVSMLNLISTFSKTFTIIKNKLSDITTPYADKALLINLLRQEPKLSFTGDIPITIGDTMNNATHVYNLSTIPKQQ